MWRKKEMLSMACRWVDGGGEVGAILKDIKDLMVARSQEKAEFADLRKELAEIKKAVPVEVKNGI